ncbi:MAG: hypothetical protein ACRDKW_13820, partial [Actinomycetota bacterium]
MDTVTPGLVGVAHTYVASAEFPNVYLRMDGRGVSQFQPQGSGTVNCQFGAASYETFAVEPHPDGDGSVALASVAFPGVYLRLDGRGVDKRE